MQALRLSDLDDEQCVALIKTFKTYIPSDRVEVRANIPHTSISVILSESRGLNLTILVRPEDPQTCVLHQALR